VDLVDHPEWALIDENGRIRRPFDAPGYRAGVHQSCTNVAGIADAYVRGVRNLMALGADGVFVDNVHPHPVCFGPKSGRHEHLYDKDNVYTYHLALRRVYEAVKEFGADKVVILNTGSGPRREFDDCGDGTMLESYICAFTPEANRRRWHNWKTIMQWAGQHKDSIGAGKAVVALSYLGHTVEPVKDDLFYSAACGRLSGFLWTGDVWSGSFIPEIRDRPGNDILRSLWRARLGAALTGLEQQENITYRLFEKGLVVVNPHSTPSTVDLPVPSGFTELSDLYTAIGQPAHDGRLSVVIPPESGRFYVEPDIAFRSSLAECILAAKGVAQRLNQLRAPTDVKDWVLLDATHQGGQGSVVVDRTQAQSGLASLRITSEGNGGQGYARSLGMMLLQKEPAPVAVSYWAKVAPDSRAAAKLTFDVDCQDGSNTSWSPPDVAEHEWTHRQATYVPPKAIHDLKVLCAASYDQPGTVWFDDVVVTVGAESANQVRNPGFEENENTMSDQALDRVQAWMDRNSPGLEQIQARYRVIPSEADQAGFVRELASRQLTVSPLLEETLDEVIRRRLDHVREYAGRALAAVTDITLQIGAPRQAVPGEKLAVELFCSNRSRQPIENVQFDLEGPAGWVVGPEPRVRRHPLEPGSSVRLPLTVSVPSTAQPGTPVLFTAIASFTRGPSPEGQRPEISVVQTHGLRVERSASPATAPAALPLEEQRNKRGDSSAKRIAPASQGSMLPLRLRRRIEVEKGSGQYRLATTTEHWEPRETAIIICDMWDRHWCKGATRRIVEMAPRINQVITEARARGVLIIHAPSRTMDFYEQTPQRRLAREAPVARPPVPLRQWCPLDAGREPPLPIDDSDGGCDCQPPCKHDSQRRRQIDAIKIGEGDAITDSLEAFYLLEQRGIKNVILMGVHVNMCILGRPFGIRQMVYQGKNVVLMRDLTDTMYNSRQRPLVSHFAGTNLVIEHIEKYWCPTITSDDILGDMCPLSQRHLRAAGVGRHDGGHEHKQPFGGSVAEDCPTAAGQRAISGGVLPAGRGAAVILLRLAAEAAGRGDLCRGEAVAGDDLDSQWHDGGQSRRDRVVSGRRPACRGATGV
jgi:nicotinamidase-related amidase